MLKSIRRFLMWWRLDHRLDPAQTGKRTLVPTFLLSFRCDVCGEERDDRHIDVYTREHIHEGGFSIRENIKFCNDRKRCIQGASDIHLLSPREVKDGRDESEYMGLRSWAD